MVLKTGEESPLVQPPKYYLRFRVDIKLTLGYRVNVLNVIKAASVMGRKSAEARKRMWGKKEFVRRMQEWGKLGGRPKGPDKERSKGRKTI